MFTSLPAMAADGVVMDSSGEVVLAMLLFALISVLTFVLLVQQRQCRQRSDRRLHEHLTLVARLFEAQPGMVFYKDRRGVYRLCNALGCQFLGRPCNDIEGKVDADFFDQVTAVNLRQHDQEAIDRRSATTLDEWLTGPDGKPVLLEVQRQPLFDDDGLCIGVLLSGRDVTESRQQQQELEYQARHDLLTGLANRSLLHEQLNFDLHMARRNDDSVAVLFIDLDRFRDINDTLGHTLGDMLLRDVAHRLRNNLRDSDICARLSGDEFVVVLTQASADYVAHKCEQLLDELSRPYQLQGHLLSMNASAGIAIAPEHGNNADILLVHADAALHQAKLLGRNRSCLYTQELTVTRNHQQLLEADLRVAVENEEFRLEYQGQFRPGESLPRRVETLIRWPHELRGLVSPHEFIPLAETSGLIKELGLWVIRRACEQFLQWRAQGLALEKIAVNVSAIQINAQFANAVAEVLETLNFEPSWLELEVTESLMMSGMTEINAQIERLRQLGVEFSIDDFGTGYSSLSKLKEMPVSVLKIDRSFVRNVHEQANDYEIARAIVAMARSLGIAVVAEGVENAEQGQTLTQLGCEWMQGYFYGRPVSGEDFSQLYGPGDGQDQPTAT
ncbi:MAG: GGDEF domain-containing protein [Pseudomonas sp.]|nr:GGDEF domain-containing protein [Pseudomonas sp.]